MKTEKQILSEKVPYPSVTSGIYFLIKNEKVVYIGQSLNVIPRITIHKKQERIAFDSFTIELCKADEMNDREADYIVSMNPPGNKTIPANSKWISLEQIKNRSGLTKPAIKRAMRPNDTRDVNGYYRIAELGGIL